MKYLLILLACLAGALSPALAAAPPLPLKISGLLNYDSININPDQGGFNLLPTPSVPCHQIGQVFVISQTCYAIQATSSAESYGYSFSMANTDTGTGTPAAGQAGSFGTDKVVGYFGADQRSTHSNLWVLNTVIQDRAGMAGVATGEFDMNRYDPCQMPVDLAWVGNPSSCPQFVGLWMTGLSAGGTGGPAMLVTGVGSTPLWNDAFAILGNSVRDSGFLDSSTSGSVIKIQGSHVYGLDAYASPFSGAAVRLQSGAGISGQGIYWQPGAGGGGADSITDTGQGLQISTDATHTVGIKGANVNFVTGAISLNSFTAPLANNGFIHNNADGSLDVGQFNVANGRLSVDGSLSTGGSITDGGGLSTVGDINDSGNLTAGFISALNGGAVQVFVGANGGPVAFSADHNGVITGNTLNVGAITENNFTAPASSTSPCVKGATGDGLLAGTAYHFACIATNQWARVAMASTGW